MTWDGKERRKDGGMSSEDHDLLRDISSDTKYLREKIDDQKLALAKHERKDEVIQGWILKIGVIVLIIVAANGGFEAIKVLFKLGTTATVGG